MEGAGVSPVLQANTRATRGRCVRGWMQRLWRRTWGRLLFFEGVGWDASEGVEAALRGDVHRPGGDGSDGVGNK